VGKLTPALVVPACSCSGNILVPQAFRPQLCVQSFLPRGCGPWHTRACGARIHPQLQDSRPRSCRCRSDGGATWALLPNATTCCLQGSPSRRESPPIVAVCVGTYYVGSIMYPCLTSPLAPSIPRPQDPRFRRLRQSHAELGGRLVGAREVLGKTRHSGALSSVLFPSVLLPS
jgi:hypothetical protein